MRKSTLCPQATKCFLLLFDGSKVAKFQVYPSAMNGVTDSCTAYQSNTKNTDSLQGFRCFILYEMLLFVITVSIYNFK